MEDKYIQDVLRSESHAFLCTDKDSQRLLHSALGMVTEAGEFADALKKNIFYGKELSVTNLKEELGDVCWYIGIALSVLGSSFEEIQKMNIAKLKVRYPTKFTELDATNRDLSKEQKALEGV